MELPAYHLPTVSNVLRSMGRGWSLSRGRNRNPAVHYFYLVYIQLWFVDGHFGMVEDLSDGILASIGQAIAWIFAPLGWELAGAVAAITGLVARKT